MSDTPSLLCPICRHNPPAKTLNAHPVCDVCRNHFANRRQGAFFIDYLILIFILYLFSLAYSYLFQTHIFTPTLFVPPAIGITLEILLIAIIYALFAVKDGFHGYSPGKFLCGLQTVDSATLKPISFRQSAKRNFFLFFCLIPFAGGIICFIVMLYIANQLFDGPRSGDRFANTSVIWKKYAHLPIFGGNALVCEGCQYNLIGNTSGTCPECGRPLSHRNKELLATPPPN